MTCGGGTKTRARRVIQEAGVVPTGLEDYAKCPALEEDDSCNVDQCPGYFFLLRDFLVFSVHCKVEDWSDWSKCSVTCGGGSKTKGRGVVQEPGDGGFPCPALEEEESCNNDLCPGNLLPLK